MWQQELIWFFAIFHQEFRKNNAIAFEVLIVLAVANLFGFYNPKQLADFLEVPHQKFYAELKDWSIYHVKKMLLRFMVKQAAEKLKPVMSKSASTRSRAGATLSIDNSVMDRFGKLIRCAYSWYSGRHRKVIRGQDLLGIVLTINDIAFPLHLLFCPKQGRYHTKKADLLIFMLTQLKAEFHREGIDITQLPLREHGDAGGQAAIGSSSAFMSRSGYQRLKMPANSPFSVRTRVCNNKCAPSLDHCIVG